MNHDDPESEQSCIWLGFFALQLDLKFMKLPPPKAALYEPLRIGFLEDEFSVYIVLSTDNDINIHVSRSLKDPKMICDSGFALRFFISVNGSDEDAKISIMKNDEKQANPTACFRIPEAIFEEANNDVVYVFMVVEMLEFESLAENHPEKEYIDNHLAAFEKCVSPIHIQRLCFLLNSPRLEDAFTGRLPFWYVPKILSTLYKIFPSYEIVAGYLSSRYHSDVSSNIHLDIHEVARRIELPNEEGPLPVNAIVSKYILSHFLGLEKLKTITRDYLLSILDTDYNVLSILEAALMVHDKCLLNTAIFSFLNRFSDVISSEAFNQFRLNKELITRYIMHASRVWISQNNVAIPGWEPPPQPAA